MSMISFVLPVRVYLDDTDAQGRVYNASYMRFFERARTEWLRSQGLDHVTLQESERISLVLSDIRINFLGPAWLDDQLHVSAELTKVSSVRFFFNQSVRRKSIHGEIVCQAIAKVACVDTLTGKPKRFSSGLFNDLRIDERQV